MKKCYLHGLRQLTHQILERRCSTMLVETSRGPIMLSPTEHALLDRLLAGTASLAEGHALYQALLQRDISFPMEWELHILRTSVAQFPDRQDLVVRLALVEETLQPGHDGNDPSARLAFERAWQRFARTDLFDPNAEEGRDRRYQSALDDACSLLASPVFCRQPLERQHQIIIALHNTLIGMPSSALPVVAELGMRRFRGMLDNPGLTEPQACAVFDALHSLYFSGVSDVRDLRRFDAIVPPFETWLEAQHGQRRPPPLADLGDRPSNIAYFLHTAHFERGNAVSRVVTSLAEMHATRRGRQVFLYAIQHVAPGFAAEMAERGVTVRSIPQDNRYDRIDEVADRLRADKIDIVVTEQNRALAAALFVRRVAPRQIWLDTGFPFWNLRALDWTICIPLQPGETATPRSSPIRLRQKAETLKGTENQEAVAALRATFPPGAFVLGVFARLIKIDDAYLEFLERLLAADPCFYLVLAGPGENKAISEFVQRPGNLGRSRFVPGAVDLNVYGPAIDVMCDTFPFVGGNACREIAAHGTPVLAKLGTPWDGLLRADRSPDLLATSEEDYIALAIRLAHDEAFRRKQRQIALEMATAYTEPTQMIEEIEAAIAAAWTYFH